MRDFFQLFRSKQLKPAWEFSAHALVWRIIFSPHHTIIGETRNQSTKSASFFCVDAQSGKPLWKEVEYDEPWWIGIETVVEAGLILHGFARPDMPEHRGIRLVDLSNGGIVWKNDELSFWFVCDQKLYAYKYIFEKRLGYEIDIRTGTLLREYSDNLEILHELRNRALQKELESSQEIIFAELLNQQQEDSETNTIIRQITEGNALEGWIEYLLRNKILLVSYYQKEDASDSATLRNVFIAYHVDRKEILLKETLATNIQVPSPDTFFVKDEFVYYLKNKNTLTAVQPWKS
jgi:hypothetical protein